MSEGTNNGKGQGTLKLIKDIGISVGGKVGRSYRVIFGKGAGYKGGSTAYLVFNGYRRNPAFEKPSFFMGWTRNSNAVPNIQH